MQISVFVAASCRCADADARLLQLSVADRTRVAAMRSEKRRSEFVSGRLLLRQRLMHTYGTQADCWHMRIAENGRPYLEAELHAQLQTEAVALPPPCISLSHSRGWVACAVGDVATLGVDIEAPRSRKNLSILAGEVFHPQELDEFSLLDDDAKITFFYAKWVMKEALGKALGCGVAYPMREVLLGQEKLLSAPKALIAVPAVWHLMQRVLPGGHSLGLAWQSENAAAVSIDINEVHL
jgi:phosphopantetheinyl transferase